MDFLSQYKQEHPEAFRPKEVELGEDDYGFIVRFVIHLPGGVIRDAKHASRILLGVAGAMIVLTLFIFYQGSGETKIPAAQEASADTPASGLRQGARIQ